MSADSMAEALWDRAKVALKVSRHCLSVSPDAAASRAYYAAFYAVSALLALGGRTFKKHSALEAAVHRDLVKPGLFSPSQTTFHILDPQTYHRMHMGFHYRN